MQILHTSDWHLGRSLHRADLTPAFELWCEHVVDLVNQRHIDAVLISGDVYDRGVPPAGSVTLFDRTLAQLAERTTVIVTSGNHDSPHRLGFGSQLMRDNVHIRTDSRRCGEPVEIRGDDGRLGALVYPIPYLDPDVERSRLAEDGEEGTLLPRSHEAVLGAALALVGADIREGEHAGADVARIVMAHAFVTGGEASPSERDIAVGGVDSVPSAMFRLGEEGPGPLSYVALGHLHSPQKVGREGDPPMRYSGSPVPFSFSETAAKSSVLLHIDGGKIDVELIDAPVWRNVRTVEGTLSQLEALAGIDAAQGEGQQPDEGQKPPAAGTGQEDPTHPRAAGADQEALPLPGTENAGHEDLAHSGAAGTGQETLALTGAADASEDQPHPGAADATRQESRRPASQERPASQDFVRVVLTDPHRPLDMASRIRRAFPNVLEIRHRTQTEPAARGRAEIAAMDPKRVLTLFMESAGNRALEDRESHLLAEIWEQIAAARTAKARS